MVATSMKIAAIDLGSNSIHMVIVEVSASGGFAVIAREKQMVRLGAGALSGRRITAAAIQRGLEAMREYRRLIESHGVETVLAVATSAVREAVNGEELLDRIGRELKIWPKAIPGDEEARLIYLAALHSVHLEGRRALVIDMGGGSIELALGRGERLELAVSEKIGVLRLTEAFVRSDPLSAKDEAKLVRRVEEALAPHAERILPAGFDVAIGTSGTILALGAMARTLKEGSAGETLHHTTVKSETVHVLRRKLTAATFRERLKMPGMDERRADIIAAGAVLLDTILQRLGVEELVLSEWALREGILIDYIQQHGRSLAQAEAYPDVRRRSVMALAERCLYDQKHAHQVAELARQLFDGMRNRHGLGEAERGLLDLAALLHDIGHHISFTRHHKHSYYLIKNGDLRGFDPREIELLASVARYHRRGFPRRSHPGFGELSRPDRRAVEVMAGCLRIAEALDRSHRQIVRRLIVAERQGVLRVAVEAEGDSELEMWGVERSTKLLERALGSEVRVELARGEGRASRGGRG